MGAAWCATDVTNKALPIRECCRAFTRCRLDRLYTGRERSPHLDGSLDDRHDVLDAVGLARVLCELLDRLNLVELLERAFAQLSLHTHTALMKQAPQVDNTASFFNPKNRMIPTTTKIRFSAFCQEMRTSERPWAVTTGGPGQEGCIEDLSQLASASMQTLGSDRR